MAMKKTIIWVSIWAVIVVASIVVVNSVNSDSSGITDAVVRSSNGLAEVSTILQGFQYNPDVITVKEGDTVRLTIDNKDNVNHGLHLPQFGIVDSIPPLVTKTVQFIARETSTNGQIVPTCSREHGETLTINVI